MTAEIELLVRREVKNLAEPGESGVQHNPPGQALATIAREIGVAYKALNPLAQALNRDGLSEMESLIIRAMPAIQGLQTAVDGLYGIENGKFVAGGLAEDARLLNAIVAENAETNGKDVNSYRKQVYSDPQQVRTIARSWATLPADYKAGVETRLGSTPYPFNSRTGYGDLTIGEQAAFAYFHELRKCGGRGDMSHGHAGVVVPGLWIGQGSLVDNPQTESAAFSNVALGEMGAGIDIGRYGSPTCAWTGFKDRTSPGTLAMVSEKAYALSQMFGHLHAEVRNRVSDDITTPLGQLATSYHKIAAAAAPAIYAMIPIRKGVPVLGLPS